MFQCASTEKSLRKQTGKDHQYKYPKSVLAKTGKRQCSSIPRTDLPFAKSTLHRKTLTHRVTWHLHEGTFLENCSKPLLWHFRSYLISQSWAGLLQSAPTSAPRVRMCWKGRDGAQSRLLFPLHLRQHDTAGPCPHERKQGNSAPPGMTCETCFPVCLSTTKILWCLNNIFPASQHLFL